MTHSARVTARATTARRRAARRGRRCERARAEALPEDEHDRRHALIDESERLYAAALKLLTDHAVACI